MTILLLFSLPLLALLTLPNNLLPALHHMGLLSESFT
jgi:hypothetical protein